MYRIYLYNVRPHLIKAEALPSKNISHRYSSLLVPSNLTNISGDTNFVPLSDSWWCMELKIKSKKIKKQIYSNKIRMFIIVHILLRKWRRVPMENNFTEPLSTFNRLILLLHQITFSITYSYKYNMRL